MTGISTIEQNNQMLQNLQQLQTQANTLGNQISTGQKSTSYAGIAAQATRARRSPQRPKRSSRAISTRRRP